MKLQQFARLAGLVALVMVLALTLESAAVQAQGTTTVAVSPLNTLTTVGSTATVNVNVTDYTNLYGADVRIQFDQSKLQVQDDDGSYPGVNVTVGPLLGSGTYFTQSKDADNSSGTIVFIITQFNPTPARSCTAPCSGTLFTIHFTATAIGVAPVNITFQKLSTPNGIQIPATPINGLVTIGAPTAATVTAFRGSVSDGAARLAWETGSEANLLGFNVWQSERAEAGYVKRNGEVIRAENPGGLDGRAYEYVDAGVGAGKTYYYKLEVVRADNSSEWMGPLTVGGAAGCAGKPPAVNLLSPANGASVGSAVTLDWSDAVCASGYRVQVRRDSTTGAVVKNARVTSSALTTELVSGGTYHWRVRSLAAKGRSKWSAWGTFTVR